MTQVKAAAAHRGADVEFLDRGVLWQLAHLDRAESDPLFARDLSQKRAPSSVDLAELGMLDFADFADFAEPRSRSSPRLGTPTCCVASQIDFSVKERAGHCTTRL
jgi:hypothetical protein